MLHLHLFEGEPRPLRFDLPRRHAQRPGDPESGFIIGLGTIGRQKRKAGDFGVGRVDLRGVLTQRDCGGGIPGPGYAALWASA